MARVDFYPEAARYDNVAAICFARGEKDPVGFTDPTLDTFYDKRTYDYGRPVLIGEVRALGTDMLVTRGTASFDTDAEVVRMLHRPGEADGRMPIMQKLGEVPMRSLDMARTVAGPLDLNGIIPVLNDLSVYTLGRNKFHIAQEMAKEGLHEGAIMVSGDISESLASIESGQVALKPVGGMQSVGVFVGNKADAEQWFQTEAKDVPYMAEAKLDMSTPLPSGIRATDERSAKLLADANRLGLPKEVRAYWFGEDDYYFVGRTVEPGQDKFGTDEWVFIDQDTIPQEFIEAAKKACSVVVSMGGLQEMNIAIDMTYATTEKDPHPKVRVMEANTREPGLVSLEDNHVVGLKQRKMLARQIVRVANQPKA